MTKSQIKRLAGSKIKFGRSMGLCAVGNYLFENALPLIDQEYQSVPKIDKTSLRTSAYEDFSLVKSRVKAREYKKEKWFVKDADNFTHHFYLWKRIS